MATPILQVSGLSLRYQTRHGEVKAVDDVSFELLPGQVMGLVGESGSGKTSVAVSLMRLLPDNARISGGQVLLDGQDLMSMGFEGSALLPLAQDLYDLPGRHELPGPGVPGRRPDHGGHRDPQPRVDQAGSAGANNRAFPARGGLTRSLPSVTPHEYSGGMRQRAVIAMSLACQPDVVIADEPTTALDVIVQDRILRRLKEIQGNLNMSMVYITHDIAVVAEVTDRIGVMYAGKLVELGDTADVFNSPIHPYTAALLSVFPSIRGPKHELVTLPGEPPNLIDPPAGCRFHPRCPHATDACRTEEPPVVDRGSHWAACWNPLPVQTDSQETAGAVSPEERQQ